MFWFSKYPYTNTEKYNLDWLVAEVGKLKANMFGKDKVTNVISPTETEKVPTSAAVNNFGWDLGNQLLRTQSFPELYPQNKTIIGAINENAPHLVTLGDNSKAAADTVLLAEAGINVVLVRSYELYDENDSFAYYRYIGKRPYKTIGGETLVEFMFASYVFTIDEEEGTKIRPFVYGVIPYYDDVTYCKYTTYYPANWT